MSGYSHPEVLCETDWVATNLRNSTIRIVEVDYDPENAYRQGHIPGAQLVWWKKDINDPLRRDIIDKQQFESLMSRIGATPDTELILYGDFNNWFAAFAFWVFQYYDYNDVRLMNGGRKKWLLEDRPMSKEIPQYAKGNFKASEADNSIRVFMNYVKESLEKAR